MLASSSFLSDMQIPIIARLVETRPLAELQAAEVALLAGLAPAFEVAGTDTAEQLTYVLVALVWRRYMQAHGVGVAEARRAFAQRVRRWVGQRPVASESRLTAVQL